MASEERVLKQLKPVSIVGRKISKIQKNTANKIQYRNTDGVPQELKPVSIVGRKISKIIKRQNSKYWNTDGVPQERGS